MQKSVLCLLACSWLVAACSVENYEECSEDEDFIGGPKGEPKGPHAGTGASSSSGASGGNGAAAAGATGGTEGAAEGPPCEDESDCDPGFNCELELGQCLPADAETCAELELEASCAAREDCTPIYAGIDCSCGPDCECVGGEPGCICQSFDFFVCQPLP